MNNARYKLTNSIVDNENANNSFKEILKFKNISIIYKDRCVLEGINMIIKFMLSTKSRHEKSALASSVSQSDVVLEYIDWAKLSHYYE